MSSKLTNWLNEKMEVTRISCHEGKDRMEKVLNKLRNAKSFIAVRYGMIKVNHRNLDKFDEFMRRTL
ncbi:hypothetical protein ACLKA6_000865 [Drosophila palustris]